MGRGTTIVAVLVLVLLPILLIAQEAQKTETEPAVVPAKAEAAAEQKTATEPAVVPAKAEAAAVESTAKPVAEKGRVIVYRYKQFVGSGLKPSIYCNDKDVARVQSGRYVALELTPGKHVFRSNDKQSQFELDVKPGQVYYIRLEIAAGFMKGHGRLILVQPEQGAGEYKQLKPVDAGMIKEKEFIATDFIPL